MTYKFEVGNEVRIVKCEDNIEEMQRMIGSICTIKRVAIASWKGVRYPAYRLAEDRCMWYWKEDWLELVPPLNIAGDVMKVFEDD